MIIKNGNVFTQNFKFEKLDVEIKDDMICSVGSAEGEEVVEAEGMYVIPGLIDQHTHGCVGFDWSDGNPDEMAQMADFYAANGVTTIAGTVTTIPIPRMEEAMKAIKRFSDEQKINGRGARVRGINLESSFFSHAKKGAHLEEYLLKPDAELVRRFRDASGDLLRIVNVAPEIEGGMDFIKELKAEMVVSVAHTSADYETVLEAYEAGAAQVTHFFNAMTSFLHRAPGAPGAVFDSELNAELICDGIHVHPAVIRTVFKIMADRVIMISDSIRACGLSDGQYVLGDLDVTVKDGKATLADGTIAGSSASLMSDLRSAVSFGVPMEQVVKAATYNPAKTLGMADQIGSIAEGYQADIVLLDEKLNIKKVYIAGKEII